MRLKVGKTTYNPKKIKLLAAIEQIIASAEPIDGIQTIQPNYKINKKPDVLRYFYLGNTAFVDGEKLTFDVIIEEDANGLLHYDLVMEGSRKEKAVADGLTPSSKPNTGSVKPLQQLISDDTVIFDDVSSNYVLNLFVFDENGNEIDDVSSENKETETTGDLETEQPETALCF